MKSFRRTQVFTANIARIANVPKRNRGSGRVVNAKTPRATYAANAIANLLVTTSDPSQQRSGFRLRTPRRRPAQVHSRPQRASNWCTGKDSNLRTSLGGTDLQSVGFNHSPTCANSSVSVEQRALSNPVCSLIAHCSQLEANSDTPQPSFAVLRPPSGDQKRA
jgi:hypothetical protein